MEVKKSTLVMVVMIIAVLVAGYFYYQKTAPERKYVKELKALRLVEEHQRLELEVANQRATLDAMRKAAEDAVPKYNLTPAEAEDKQKALKEANK